MEAAKVDLEYDEIEIGENVYLAGHTSGIKPSDWDTLRRNPAFLKAPITTPVGKVSPRGQSPPQSAHCSWVPSKVAIAGLS